MNTIPIFPTFSRFLKSIHIPAFLLLYLVVADVLRWTLYSSLREQQSDSIAIGGDGVGMNLAPQLSIVAVVVFASSFLSVVPLIPFSYTYELSWL